MEAFLIPNFNYLIQQMSTLRKVLKKIKTNELGDKFSVFTDVDNTAPHGYISTGDDILDLKICNVPRGGVPLGRYLNIYSDSGLGKSLLVYKLIANAQKQGGIGIYYDTENGAFKPYMQVLGVDEENLIYTDEIKTVEDIFQSIIELILSFNEEKFEAPLVIAVDSMYAVTTKTGADLDIHEKQGYGIGAEKQMVLNDELKKVMNLIKGSNILFVTTDQIRDNIGAFANQSKVKDTAGHAQKFFADIRLEIKKKATLKQGDVEVGNEVVIKTEKSRVAPPKQKCRSFIYHTRGIDNYMSWIENGSDLGIIEKGKGTLKFKDEKGEIIRIDGKLPRYKDFRKIMVQYPEIKSELYNQFCEKLIIQYENIEDLDLTDLDDTISIDDDHNLKAFKKMNAKLLPVVDVKDKIDS